eukprot:3815425-Rhodomonas_salina.2
MAATIDATAKESRWRTPKPKQAPPLPMRFALWRSGAAGSGMVGLGGGRAYRVCEQPLENQHCQCRVCEQ